MFPWSGWSFLACATFIAVLLGAGSMMFQSSSVGSISRLRKTSSIPCIPGHEILGAPATPRTRAAGRPALSVRLGSYVTLEPHASGEIVAHFPGNAISLGTFSASAANRSGKLRSGVAFSSLKGDDRPLDRELLLIVRRLAQRGLLQYRLRPS